jgi:hypothetical protein
VSLRAAPESRHRADIIGLVGRAVRALVDRALACGVPLKAFVCSRVLILLAGIAALLAVPRPSGVPVRAEIITQLGPMGKALLTTVVRGDAVYYLDVASHGFVHARPQNLAFFPLYPSLIRVLGFFIGSNVVAGALISIVAFALALVLLHRLAELELGHRAADATVLLLAFAPLSFFFTAIYTESLFLLLSVGSVLAARRERWALAGVLGGLATLTRVTGILLIVPLAIMRLHGRRQLDRQLLWTLFPLAALGTYLAILAVNGFSWLAPFRAEAFWGRVNAGPIVGIASALVTAVKAGAGIIHNGQPLFRPTYGGPLTPDAETILLLCVLAIAIAFLVSCFRRLPVAYAAYAAAALVMCVSSPAFGQPLFSLDRLVLTIFPLWMAAGAWIAKRRLERVAVVAGSILLVFYTLYFARGAFIA